jgi:hypothetical protein
MRPLLLDNDAGSDSKERAFGSRRVLRIATAAGERVVSPLADEGAPIGAARNVPLDCRIQWNRLLSCWQPAITWADMEMTP